MARKGQTKAPKGQGGPRNISIATTPPMRIPNTDKRQMDQAKENVELKMTTCYGNVDGTPAYDDVRETGVQYSHPAWNETSLDKSDRVPAWTSIKGYSLEDKD